MKYSHSDYTVAWVCALPLELAAAEALLDETHDRPAQVAPASTTYVLGKISGHNVVLVCLPSGEYGTISTASVVSHILATFPAVRHGILVGIAGGVPNNQVDIRLGDLVVSEPTADSSGVFQYDFGKALHDGRFQQTRTLNRPSPILLTAVSQLKSRELRTGTNGISVITEEALKQNPDMAIRFSKPPAEDRLFQATYSHVNNEDTCWSCDRSMEVKRVPRPSTEPHIHYGVVASGNQVIKDGQTRDRIAKEHHCLCFEMEAAGLLNELPCLVIRGICDYCDSHKNKKWQGYAAFTAAVYAKFLLGKVPTHRQSLLTGSQSYPKPCWMVPFEKNPRFIGCSREVANLEEKILGDTGMQKAAISGLGGVGKTQIALAVAYRIRERDPNRSIFWIPSTSVETVEQAFQSIGEHFSLQNPASADMKLKVQRYLSSDRAGPWLLIVDNADDMDMWTKSMTSPALRSFLPHGTHGFILFTTRNQQLATKLVGPDVMQISEMDATVAKDLLRKSLIEKELTEDKESTTKLIDQLHGLPLAIVQAASYINENSISLAQYMILLNQQESGLVELLSHDFEDDWRYTNLTNPVATTWLISFDQIRRSNVLAANYLSFMSCIDPREIPQSLLPNNNTSLPQQIQALGVLKSYSFVTAQTNSQLLSIHRLVHFATRSWLRKEKRLDYWRLQASERLREAFPSAEPENRLLWRAYLPHAQIVLHSVESFEAGQGKWREELSNKVGQCLFSDGRYTEAEALLRQVFETRQVVLGPDHPGTLTSMNNLGLVLNMQGKYEEAEMIHRQTLKIKEKVLELDHPDTLASMNNLGLVLNMQGKYEEAEMMYRQVHRISEKVLGPDHPNTLMSMNNLGSVLNMQGKYEEAEMIHRQTLKISEKVLGLDHPSTLASMNNLSSVLDMQGKNEEAEKILRQTLKTSEKVLGLDHPNTLTSMNNLGSVLNMQGKYEEAEMIHRQTLKISEKVLGLDHPGTLASMNNLGSVLDMQGKNEEAEKILRQTLKTSEKVLGLDHPNTLTSMNNLGSALDMQGKYEEAETIYQQALKIKEKVLGLDHPSTLMSMNNLGLALDMQGKYEEAETMLRQTLKISERVLGLDHPDTLRSMWGLSYTWKRQGRHVKALDLLQTCVSLQGIKLGPEHPETKSATALLNYWLQSSCDPSVIPESSQIVEDVPQRKPRKRDIIPRLLRKR
ncbi:hypothetical protein BGW36DRAFT_343579 [Talaromyces proteolyticus]|uniref:Nucleoside phosphorylase domain-containing protein n=1 Tax=Talaromyces proteolyticus TaxID=1131652 RepID=A0AAD4Q036_9EURO|nr:uncharacterized protein BGW36DRAFT_343579 [Talaromyces proteolyticus]KAH8696621.1 hypothetical protein BGW36DRAFT_343579 [Talaromyces proteolyticus]